MLLPKFTISQLLAWMIAFGSTFGLVRISGGSDTLWTTSPLAYNVPEVPTEYDDNGRDPPCFLIGTLCPPETYSDGRDLYQSSHWNGWARCRRTFYDSRHVLRDFSIPRIESLPANAWTGEHAGIAFATGYKDCLSQLDALSNQYSEQVLRSKIGFHRRWRTIPLGITAFLSLVAIALLRPQVGDNKGLHTEHSFGRV